MRLFFYGTLRHLPLLQTVLGQSLGDLAPRPAVLPDHAVREVEEGPFPMILPEKGAMAEGIVVDLTGEVRSRLDYYEGGFDYDLRGVTLADGSAAQVYFPAEGRWTPGAPWSLDGWVAEYGQRSLDAANEAMAHFGRLSPEALARRFSFFRARAWARHLARDPAPAERRRASGLEDVKIARDSFAFDGFFRIRSFDLKFRKYRGGWSDTFPREVFIAFDAALVLPYDPARDRVLLIEQLRFGPIGRGDPKPWVLEPVAGLLDDGETPEDCARREAAEEAGLQIGRLMKMPAIYASPGYSSEFFHCFLGLVDLPDGMAGIGGLDSENEDIRSHVMSFDEAMTLLDSGEVNAGPLAMMLLWLARERAALRSG